jgi:hypothetical protein
MASETEIDSLQATLKWHQELVAEMQLRLENLDQSRETILTSEYERRLATITEMKDVLIRNTEELQVQVDTQAM